ncbi:MAG: hypothetical protein ABSE05_11360 [Syntrophales bacterium]
MPYRPTPRGLRTFVPIRQWPDDERPRAGDLKKPVVELAVNYSIPDICTFIIRIEEWVDGCMNRVVWTP